MPPATPAAIAAQYAKHRTVMHRAAASVLREAGQAAATADVVSDAIESILKSPPTNVSNWQAFLVTAAKRKAIDNVRSAAVRHAGPELEEHLHDRPERTDVDLAEDAAERIDLQRDAPRVWDALSVLDDRHRTAVWEYIALERPRKDVADQLGVTPARVNQMTKHALEQLRAEMERQEGKGDE
jgi:RNA polymerase sigma factor (sigma-70 family)